MLPNWVRLGPGRVWWTTSSGSTSGWEMESQSCIQWVVNNTSNLEQWATKMVTGGSVGSVGGVGLNYRWNTNAVTTGDLERKILTGQSGYSEKFSYIFRHSENFTIQEKYKLLRVTSKTSFSRTESNFLEQFWIKNLKQTFRVGMGLLHLA